MVIFMIEDYFEELSMFSKVFIAKHELMLYTLARNEYKKMRYG
jgi:hypothetical protein